jgi:anti-sigma regulatory factor (Ser/Thr protein kinase)
MEPGQSLKMNGLQSRTIRLSINPHADFREVIRILDAIVIPPARISIEHIRFAILELLNNSIRAHREKGESRDIWIDLSALDGRFMVSVRDFGGGFDTRKLPYDLGADPRSLDLHSSSFEEYQKKNGYKRFGMGIYVARKTFEEFRLVFLDERDQPMSYRQGQTAGTLITLAVSMGADAAEPAPRKGGSAGATGGGAANGK